MSWPFSTIVKKAHSHTVQLSNYNLNVQRVHCMAMTLLKHVIKVWQLYCMAVKLFDNCTVWLWAQNLFDNFNAFSWNYLSIFDCHHALQMVNFPVKIIWDFFDNFTVWLWTFLTIVLYGHDPMKHLKYSLTIVRYGCELFWQLYCMAIALMCWTLSITPYF